MPRLLMFKRRHERPPSGTLAPAVLGDHDPATARRLVPGLPWHTLVDRAARTEGLALRDVLSAGAPVG